MRRNLLFAALTVAMTAGAQETYDNAILATRDLNGTARYVGMGGAMDALGADLSVISSNPAGIGLFRSSQTRVTFGMMSQQDAPDFAGASKSHASFDQAGFVYSMRTGRQSFVNFAFNYHKSRDFNQILTAAGKLGGASQNQLSYGKYANGLFDMDVSNDGDLIGYQNATSDYASNMYNQVDYLYWNALLAEIDDQGNISMGYNPGESYAFGKNSNGYIGDYDLNISGNFNDRFYWGLTVGIHDVHYNGYTEYAENLLAADNQGVGSVTLTDDRSITGTGFDIKAGVIVRPVEESPFRIGLSVATPTWYELTSSNYTKIYNNSEFGMYDDGSLSESFKFKLNTPWTFGLSLGTTVGDYLALGAVYEYADYGSLDTRIITDYGYDYWDDTYWSDSESDRAMNSHTKKTLEGVSTLKLGVEYRPDPTIAVRFGYNYVSPMYKEKGSRNVDVDSPYAYYASTTDYTNWEATNRITCGVGFTMDKFTMDLGYQYTVQDGKFYPFNDTYMMEAGARVAPAKVSDKRHQVMMTLGYNF